MYITEEEMFRMVAFMSVFQKTISREREKPSEGGEKTQQV